MTCAEQIINKIEPLYKNKVAFVCYNASMWDSLESVYLLAKKKGWKIDIYAPYYHKGYNYVTEYKKLRKLIKHKVLYKYNPNTRYDIIFNNNPYDEDNYVTCLDGKFWNSNLSKICNCLVYIPYASVPNYVDKNAIITNGVLMSDMVVVENEFIKKLFCDTIREYLINIGFTNNEDCSAKIFAFGSPKYDKVLNDKKENYKLPKKWKKMIGNKKVVTLNTSLIPMLNNENKLNDIARIIDEYCDDDEYILWWRPHPLTVATLETLKPHLLKDYIKLIEWYKDNNIGIFDDTENLHRSIAYSDYCISDQSSVRYLYEVANKKIILIDKYIDKLKQI